MGWLQSDCINKGLCSSIHVPQPKIGKSYQVITVRLIPFIQVIIKNQEVRKRYRKITYPHYIKDMLLSIVQKLVKPCRCLYRPVQFFPGQSLIVDHISRLVIVIHHSSRFIRTDAGFFKIRFCRCLIAPAFFYDTQIIVYMIILTSFQLAFPKVLRIAQSLLQKFFRLIKVTSFHG